MRTYTVQRRWPTKLVPKPGWRFVPEHEGLSLKRAREVVQDAKHWHPCGLQQRLVNSSGRIISRHRARIASPERQHRIRIVHLPEIYLCQK